MNGQVKLAALFLICLSLMSAYANADEFGAAGMTPYRAYIPEDKGLDPAWVASLTQRGERRVYSGDELRLIGMPCGGIGAGQMEVTGDGRLGTWWIFNISPKANDGLGFTSGARYLKPAPIEQTVKSGFAVKIRGKNIDPIALNLNGSDFDDIRFVGEYPIASLDYRRKAKDLPVEISSEVFSPFIPLSVRDSANPVTVVQFTVKNTSKSKVNIDLGGWLGNPCKANADQRVNKAFARKGIRGVQLGLLSEAGCRADGYARAREEVVFDRFEGESFKGRWTAEGQAFGNGPMVVSKVHFNTSIRQYEGKAIASSFHTEKNEKLVGKLLSKPFLIDRGSIRFKIAGGSHKNQTCINLLVDGKVVRTATGNNSNTFSLKNWNVEDLKGKTAQIQIVDEHKASWGFVKVDEIVFIDTPSSYVPYGTGRPDYGNLAISVMDDTASTSTGLASLGDFVKTLGETKATEERRQFGIDEAGGGSVASRFNLAPNESKTVTFLISWYFPNLYNKLADGLVGHIYNNWYGSSADAAEWVADNYERLYEQTELFRRTYHDTTLPYWLANRISMPVSSLACDNIKIHADGRMYSYEGVNFCHGTCGHVYNFVTAIANMFPELERSVRLMQDFDERWGFDPLTGRINFRGHDGPNANAKHDYASDAQSGYVLKAYREHLKSSDDSFLKRNWPKIKMAMHYQIFRDGAERGLEPNGVLEGKQTFWDPMYYGPNPYNNTLYLAALRASEEMAKLMGESHLARRYRELAESGKRYMQERMWNGEYYVHLYPEGRWARSWNGLVSKKEEQENAADFVRLFGKRDSFYYVSTACDATQLIGQNLAHQLGLGYILPPDSCKRAVKSIFKYNYAPDISMVYNVYPPKHRTLAAPGEAALVNGAWPKIRRQSFENIHDKDDVWTGLEYEASCDMINEGLLQEAFVVLKSIDQRYDARKRNPWNEIEGAEHYVRAMHSWNVLLALSGFYYDGPAGRLGFAPRITPESFRCFFSGAEGWGAFSQKLSAAAQQETIEVKWGKLKVKTLIFELPEGKKLKQAKVTVAGSKVSSNVKQDGKRITLDLEKLQAVKKGQNIQVALTW